jgi:hypothetical protein
VPEPQAAEYLDHTVRLRWKYDGLLADDEWFKITVRGESTGGGYVVYQKGGAGDGGGLHRMDLDASQLPPDSFDWSVVTVVVQNGVELGAVTESAAGMFHLP